MLTPFLLPSIKQTGALWQDTMCSLKKTAAGDKHVRELCDTKLCGLLDFFLSAFLCSPTRICKIKQRDKYTILQFLPLLTL